MKREGYYKGYYIRVNLQLFAKDGPGGEKTEPATTKKLNDAREDGKVAKSKEIVTAVFFVAFFALVRIICAYMGQGFVDVFTASYNGISSFAATSGADINLVTIRAFSLDFLFNFLLLCAPIMLLAVVIDIVGNVVQVKWKATAKPLMPKLNKISPISGFKRIFSVQSLITLFKSVAIVGICMIVVYQELVDMRAELFNLYEVPLMQAIIIIGNIIFDIGFKISIIYLIVGVIDFIYQKRKFSNDMKMTKQEVKDEYKDSEGDPQIKGRIRQIMRQASQRRMMQSVPEADVVITNPTHYAVALKYDTKVADAPIVLAKGADFVAQKIKEVAKENQIYIHENKPLARALYGSVEIGQQIPPELFQAVAEVIAMVYSKKEEKIR